MYNRPTGVTVLAALSFLGGVWGLFAAANYFAWSPYGDIFSEGHDQLFPFIYRLVYASALLVLGYGLWYLKPWARIASILVAGINLLFNIIAVFSFTNWNIDWVSTIISAVIIAYLIRGDIAYTFKG